MPLVSPPRVFLSYARKDGEIFAGALRQRLAIEEPEITLWQDRTALEGGVGWWAQIEAALDQVTFLVLVMTPAALESKTTRQEWQAARQRGVKVYPVKGAPDDQIDYGRLPSWMRKAHFFDIGQFADGRWHGSKEWHTFVNYLKSDPQRMRQPFMAPELHDFVSRRREIDQLLQLVLDPALRDPVAITTALQGAGGYGKTTLAMALCHDERVIEAFDDGVLWVSLGQTPQLLDELTKLYEALSGQARAFVDVAQASAMLAERLAHKHCLLVIDDVWHRAHLEPFLKGATQSARLVTTRRLDLLKGAPRVRVDEMSAAESVRLLGMAFPAGTVADARLEPLARRLGEWPLLLKLAAGMIRARLARGDSIDGALIYVNRALDRHGVTAFDSREPAQRDEAVRGTVSASLDQLSAEEGRRFRELAIFPEETAIPLTTLERLWGLDDLDTADCARRLDDVALLVLDLRRGIVSLHDVMRAYLLRELGDAVAVHARLVAGYGDPRQLPDLYAWRWLPTHMAHAGQTEPLRALLLQPDWLEAKIRAVGAPALIRDFDLTRGDADLDVVQAALRLSLPALSADAGQLCEQLLGRLPRERSARIESFKQDLSRSGPQPRLHARWPSLREPGSGLLQTLRGHKGPVKGALALRDERVLSWGVDGTVRVWDLTTGEGRALAGVADSPVDGAALLSDGTVVSWNFDGTMRVWDPTKGDGRTLRGHRQPVRGVLPLPDGGILSWSADGTLRVWEMATGRSRVLSGTKPVMGALLLNDEQAVSWTAGSVLHVWHLGTGEKRALIGHERRIHGALVLPDERLLSWSADRTLRIWNVATGECYAMLTKSALLGALWLSDDRILFWSRDGTLIVWTWATALTRVVTGRNDEVQGATLLPDGRVLTWNDLDTLSVWDLSTCESAVLSGDDGTSSIAGAMALRDERALSWGGDRTLRVWHLTTGEGRVLFGHEASVDGAILLSDERVLSWSADATLRVWDSSSKKARSWSPYERSVAGALRLADGRALSWSSDGVLRLWDLSTGGACVPTGHRLDADGTGRTLARFLPPLEGALLLSHGWVLLWGSAGVAAWNPATRGTRISKRVESWILGALLLPARRVLLWGREERLLVWDMKTGDCRALIGHREPVAGALLLPDRRVLSWSVDEPRPLVWTLRTGRYCPLAGHESGVLGALLLSDGRVATWSDDESLRVWDLDSCTSFVLISDRFVHGARELSDGSILWWNRYEGTLRVQDVERGEPRELIGHRGSVAGALVMWDGRIVSWSTDCSIHIWDLKRDVPPLTFYFDATPTVVVPDPSGELLVGDAIGGFHLLELPARRP